MKSKFKKLVHAQSVTQPIDPGLLRVWAELEFNGLHELEIKSLVIETLQELLEGRLLTPGTMDPQNKNWLPTKQTAREMVSQLATHWDFLTIHARDFERPWFRAISNGEVSN